MKLRNPGKSGVKVSVIGLGINRFGSEKNSSIRNQAHHQSRIGAGNQSQWYS